MSGMSINVNGITVDGLHDYGDEDEGDQSRDLEEMNIVFDEGDYTFEYTYPLSKKATFIHRLGPNTSAYDLIKLGSQDYHTIYREEDETTKVDATPAGLCLNRSRTNGKYGIWGHDIGDLVFEGINIKGKTITFDIGS